MGAVRAAVALHMYLHGTSYRVWALVDVSSVVCSMGNEYCIWALRLQLKYRWLGLEERFVCTIIIHQCQNSYLMHVLSATTPHFS